MRTETKPQGDELTPFQRALVESERGVARRAVALVLRVYGRRIPYEEAERVAERAVMEAARTFDPAKGSFGPWAYRRAIYAILDAARVERGQEKALRRLRSVVVRRLSEEGYVPPVATSIDELTRWEEDASDELAACASSYVDTVLQSALTPEQTVLAVEEAERTARALRIVVDELRPDERELLRLQFDDDQKVKVIAKSLGVDYDTLLDRANALKRRMKARLAFLGVRFMPDFLDLEPGELLGRRPGEEEPQG